MSGLRTSFTDLLGIEHPIVSAGMAGSAGGQLAGRVSEAGGLGVIGASAQTPEWIRAEVGRARELTDRPFAVNLLLFRNEELVEAVLEHEPSVLSTAWAREDQDLARIFARAHERGVRVMHMVTAPGDARAAVEAGADVVVAQGTEGGGHVGEIGTTVIVRQVVKEAPDVPVLAAGGFADGAGLAAALALGADGVLLGTRFLATDEAVLHELNKEGVVATGSGDTIRTSVLDAFTGNDWPGAWSRARRSRFVEEWLGREPELRRRREEVRERLRAAYGRGDPDQLVLWVGQSAGLVDAVEPASELVDRIVREAELILRERLPGLLR